MSLRSKLKIESVGMSAAFAFYAIAGIIFLAEMPLADFAPHIGMIGILSLITAYGLFRKRVWALWLIVALSLIATTFSAYTIYYLVGRDLLLNLSVIGYLVLTWIFTGYAAAKRKTLES
jgi:uncharacterized membrane protein (DUF2068 family)